MRHFSWTCLFAVFLLLPTLVSFAAEEEVDLDAEEKEVDLDEEEKATDKPAGHPGAHHGGVPGAHPTGSLFNRQDKRISLIFDLLVDYRVGSGKFDFRPNHTFVLVQAQVTDTVTFIGHTSDNPLFFEMSWQILPELTLKAGKLLVLFGSNEYHHLIGGRVDEFSDFLPETKSTTCVFAAVASIRITRSPTKATFGFLSRPWSSARGA